MIKNWDYQKLRIDFSSMYEDGNHPSDLDMFYLRKDGGLLIGEAKNETHGYIDKGQKRVLERLVNGWGRDAVAILFVHDKYFQDGDRVVPAYECYVKEIYYKSVKEWREPREPTTVKQVIDYYRGKA